MRPGQWKHENATWEKMYNGEQGHSCEGKMLWRQKHEDERVGRCENASLLWEIMGSWGRSCLAVLLLGNEMGQETPLSTASCMSVLAPAINQE